MLSFFKKISPARLLAGIVFALASCGLATAQTFTNDHWLSAGAVEGGPGVVQAITLNGTEVYVGGDFTSVGGTSANRVARWDGVKWNPLGSGLNGRVNALAISGGNLYAAGQFTAAGGVPAQYIAKWDGTKWTALGSGAGGWIYSLKAVGGDLYVGGNFHTIGGVAAHHVAKWNGSSWSALGSGLNSATLALEMWQGELYAVGSLSSGGQVARIAKWNGSSWLPVAGGPDGPVRALVAAGPDLYAGGLFTTAGGVAAGSVAKWNGGVWTALGEGLDGTVHALAVSSDGSLYAGGEFVETGDLTVNRIARWKDGAWSPLGSGTSGTVLSLAAADNNLYAGGTFLTAGGKSIRRLARVHWTPPPPSILFPPLADVPFSEGSTVELAGKATVSSGAPVSFSLESGPAVLHGTLLAISAPGRIVVRASAAGAPPVTRAFDSYLETGSHGVADLAVTPDWFHDDVNQDELVGILSGGFAGETGGTLTYTLVSGNGGGDNGKFKIQGNRLIANSSFDYHEQKRHSIRVKVEGPGGKVTHGVLTLNVIATSPAARFEKKEVFTAEPGYVNAIFQLREPGGEGINLPRELFERETGTFQVREDGAAISAKESFLHVSKLGEVPSVTRTVLLLDNSSSLGVRLLDLRRAAKDFVGRIADGHEVAVYSFSGTSILRQDFTNDPELLKQAIDGIQLGSPTTDLYGSAADVLDRWTEVFSQDGIATGFLVVFTDGADTTGRMTLDELIEKRDGGRKKIFALGLGSEVNPDALAALGNAGSLIIESGNDLEAAFANIRNQIENELNSYYWVNYASPKRGDAPPRTLTISLKGNTYTGEDSSLEAEFSSAGFTDVPRGVVIGRSAALPGGVTEEVVAPDGSRILRAFTILPLADDAPEYEWSIGDESLATLTVLEEDGSRLLVIPQGAEGSTTLSVTDVNSRDAAVLLGLDSSVFTRTITLTVGAASDAPASQFILFPPLPDVSYGAGATVDLAAVSSSGMPVAYEVISGPGKIEGSVLTILGPGRIEVRASQPGGGSFAPAPSVTHSFFATVQARFYFKEAFRTYPSHVNAIFRLRDENFEGIDIPRELFEQGVDIFRVEEDDRPVSPRESFLQVGKIGDVRSVIRTVLMLDNSPSMGVEAWNRLRAEAEAFVSGLAPGQEVAIYTFAGGFTLCEDFTNDPERLKEAIRGIQLGGATTDLYGDAWDAIDLWNELYGHGLHMGGWIDGQFYDQGRIETGFLVIFTDGADTSRRYTLEELKEKRDGRLQDEGEEDRGIFKEKSIFTIGFGPEVDPEALAGLGNAGSILIDSADEIGTAFEEVRRRIHNELNSLYWLNYASPRRDYDGEEGSEDDERNRKLTIYLNGNTSAGGEGGDEGGWWLEVNFSSTGFSDVQREVAINRSAAQPSGVWEITLGPWASRTVRAHTILPLADEAPDYQWSVGNESLVSLEPDGSRMWIISGGTEGTTTLSVTDVANQAAAIARGEDPSVFTRTITLEVAGMRLDPPVPIRIPTLQEDGSIRPQFYGSAGLSFFGKTARSYTLQASGDLKEWEDLRHFICSDSGNYFIDDDGHSKRFYRVREN